MYLYSIHIGLKVVSPYIGTLGPRYVLYGHMDPYTLNHLNPYTLNPSTYPKPLKEPFKRTLNPSTYPKPLKEPFKRTLNPSTYPKPLKEPFKRNPVWAHGALGFLQRRPWKRAETRGLVPQGLIRIFRALKL